MALPATISTDTKKRELEIMRKIFDTYKIGIFFILTLLIGWFPWYTGRGSIIIAAPSLAAFIVAFLANGWDGVLRILKRLGRWRANWKWYAFILFPPGVHICFAAPSGHIPESRSLPKMRSIARVKGT